MSFTNLAKLALSAEIRAFANKAKGLDLHEAELANNLMRNAIINSY